MPYRKASTAAIVAPCFVNGLHLVRELARKGAYTVAADCNPTSIAFRSRYARECVVLPDPRKEEGALADLLLKRRDLYGGLVVPSDDAYLREVHSHWDELSRHYRLAVSPGKSTAIALDKDRAYQAAAEAGLLCPQTIEIESAADLPSAIGQTGLPAILRAAFSLDFVKDFACKSFFVTSLDEAKARLDQALASGHRMLLQEVVPGPDRLIVSCRGYAYDSGELSPMVCSSKRLQYPPLFGISNINESIFLPEIAQMTTRLLKHLGVRGTIFSNEFKYDRRTGAFKFIELNCRSVLSTGFAKYSGVDLVEHLWRDKMGLPPPVSRLRLHRRWTYIKDALLRHRGYPQHRLSAREYWRLYRPPIGLALFDARDLRPFLLDIKPLIFRRLKL